MSTEEVTNEQFTDQQPRCEIDTLFRSEGRCRKLGEVRLDGSMLCVLHAEFLNLRQRSEALLGEVFKMDEWLESADGETDELRVRRVEHHRNELVEQLRFNRTRIDLIGGALLKDQDGTP